MTATRFRDNRWLHRALIVAIAVIAYAPSLLGYFISDDFHLVLILDSERRAVDWPNVLSDFYTVWRHDPTHSYYRPMITLSGAIDFTIWGPNPFGFHLTNLALHAANGLLVYGLANAALASHGGLPGLTAALLFVLYPLQPDRIYRIIGRGDTLATLFALSALLLFFHATRSGRGVTRTCSLLAFALALATKETTVTVPFAVALGLAAGAAARPSGTRRELRREIAWLLPYALLLGAYFLFRKAITGHVAGQYGASGLDVLTFAAFPIGLLKFLAYQMHPVGWPLTDPGGNVLFASWQTRGIAGLGWTTSVTIAALILMGRRERRAWMWLAMMLVLAAPLLSLHAAARSPYEYAKLHYLPSAPFCIALVLFLEGSRPRFRRWLGGVIFFAYSALLVVNSLPWIYAGQITQAVVRQIERAANRPGIRTVFVDGDPQGYLTAELFGRDSWALAVAAGAPYASIPNGVTIVNLASDGGRQALEAARRAAAPFVILRYDPSRRSLEEVAGSDPSPR